MRRTFSKISRRSRTSIDSGISGISLPNSRRRSSWFADTARRWSISSNDIVIAIMGAPRSGKSTFIEQLVQYGDKSSHKVYNYQSDSEDGVHKFTHRNGQKIYFLELSGFDDPRRSDAEVLEEIAYSLGSAYSEDTKLAGVVYLHRIDALAGDGKRNVRMVERLCGAHAVQDIVVAASMCDVVGEKTASESRRRERELVRQFDLMGKSKPGNKILRYNGTGKSALSILDAVLKGNQDLILDIQRQLIDEGKLLAGTTVGQELQLQLQHPGSAPHLIDPHQQASPSTHRSAQILAQDFHALKTEGDKRMQRQLEIQHAENLRNKRHAELLQKHIAALAARQEEEEARMDEEEARIEEEELERLCIC